MEFNHFRRGKTHTRPSHEKDVAGLQGIYDKEKAHVYKPGRKLADADKAKDFLAMGSNPESLQGMMTRWAKSRVVEKATTDNWETAEEVLKRLKEERERDAEQERDQAEEQAMEVEVVEGE